MRRSPATAAVLVAVILLGAGALASLGANDAGRAAAPPRQVVRIDTRAAGNAVPPSFLGFSIEWDSILPYTGPAAHRHGDLLRLLEPLRRAAGSPLALRIGGDSADQAWWNPTRRRRPRTVLQDIGPHTLGDLAWLARGLGGPVTLGLNLALQDPANAGELLHAARAALPRGAVTAAEIGNEPDLYRRAMSFRRGGHLHRRLAKDPHYDVRRYGREAARYLAALDRPGAPHLVVGGFATRSWWSYLPALMRRWQDRPKVIAAHLYALPDCTAPTPSDVWLMSARASRHRVDILRPLAAFARRHRLPLHVAELNSAACGGRPHWSATPAAALWLTDTLFAMLRLGAAQVDVHTWRGARYAPFVVTQGGAASSRPPLAGMLAFARAAPLGSHLVRAAVSGPGTLRAWATQDRAGITRVALLSPEGDRAVVPADGRTGCAQIWRSTGAQGACRCPVRGTYVVDLRPASVAVLTLPAPGTTAACHARASSQRGRRGPTAA
jgi:hypothetical protein